MYWDIEEVKPESHLNLSVRFSDGLAGNIRFHTSHLTGVFEPLKEVDFFKKVFVHDGAVTWPGEIDLAPDAMYDAIKESNNHEWILK